MKSQQLLTQGKIFEDEILAGPECTNNPAEEVPEPYDHAQNLTGTLSIELGAKSLILQVYDVLMNDNPQRKRGETDKLDLRSTAPVLDPTRSYDVGGTRAKWAGPRSVPSVRKLRGPAL